MQENYFSPAFILTKYIFTNQVTLLSTRPYLFLFFPTLAWYQDHKTMCISRTRQSPKLYLVFPLCTLHGCRSWFVRETENDDLGHHDHNQVWHIIPTSCTTILDWCRDPTKITNPITITIKTWSWSNSLILSQFGYSFLTCIFLFSCTCCTCNHMHELVISSSFILSLLHECAFIST